jgi:suppressor for copper-sensitivity B
MISTMTSPPRAAAAACLIAFVAALILAAPASAQPKPRAKLSTALNVTALQPAKPAVLAVVVDVDQGLHAQSRTPLTDNLIRFDVKLDANPAVTLGEPVFPEGEIHEYPALGKLSVYTGRVVVYVPITLKPDVQPGPVKLTGRATYQICDDKMCFPPERPKFEIDAKVVSAGQAVQPNQPELFAAWEKAQSAVTSQPPVGRATVKPTAAPVKIFGLELTSNAYLLAFAGAFIVGMLFNVMPCVLPVVPLKAVGFYEVSQHNRAKSLALGATFSAGLIASFAVLGLFVVVLRVLNWGELFQQTWFRGTIIFILVAMAVSTFGVFTVNVPTAVYRFAPRHDTYVGNFLFGILTAALSTPCTFGMFVGILTWALTQPSAIGMALLTMVGVGMAFPYFLLSAFPEIARRLPRTGPWAELVKQMMSFLLLATAIYFARPFIDRLLSSDVFWWLLFAIVAVAAAYLVVRTVQFAPRLTPRLVAAVIALLMVVPAFLVARNLTYHPHDWVAFTDQALEAARGTGKPVLVEFTADWCGNCQWVEAFVLNNRRVVSTLKEHDVVMIKADVTDGDEPAVPLLGELNPAGAIPLTAIFAPGRPEPILLNGIYSAEELQRAVQEAMQPSGAVVADNATTSSTRSPS